MPFGGGKKKRIAEFLKAAEDGDGDAVERLLTKGVGADEQNEGGWSAIALAANGGLADGVGSRNSSPYPTSFQEEHSAEDGSKMRWVLWSTRKRLPVPSSTYNVSGGVSASFGQNLGVRPD